MGQWIKSIVALWLASAADAAVVTFKNQCNHTINVYDNHGLCDVAPGSKDSPTFGCNREIALSAMYRHGENPEATLTEFSYGGGKSWYDISIIPPGSGTCTSLRGCQEATQKKGFNVATMIYPSQHLGERGYRCEVVICQDDGCVGAYNYPTDDGKVYSCPDDEHFYVIYCP